MDIKVDIQGLKGVEDALADAGPKLARRALARAIRAGADVFVAEAKLRAPIIKIPTKNRRQGELRDSIVAVVRGGNGRTSAGAKIGPRRTEGESNQTPGAWGLMVEFGTRHSKAQPYLRPAFDAGGEKAVSAFTEVIQQEVKKLNR